MKTPTGQPRLLFVHPSDELYGADRMLLASVQALRESYDITVWISNDISYPHRLLSEQLRGLGVSVACRSLPVLRRAYLTPRRLPWLLRRMVRTLRVLRAQQPDLVYVNTSSLLPVAPLARLCGSQVLLHQHESWGRMERILLGAFLLSTTRIVAISHTVAALLPAWSQSKVRLIVNGTPEPAGAVAPARLGVADGTTTFLIASRWLSWKGHQPFLRAWESAGRRDAHLFVLGGPPPTGAAVDVCALANSMSGRAPVTLVGEVADLTPYLRAVDCVVMPSTHPEPFGLVAIEAAACATPTLASDLGGLREIVVDGVTGWRIPVSSHEAWVAGIEAVTPAEAGQRGAAARRHFEGRFSLDRFQAEIRDVVSDTVRNAR